MIPNVYSSKPAKQTRVQVCTV